MYLEMPEVMKKIIANLIIDHNRSELLGHWLVKDKLCQNLFLYLK
jgi:hypothetical protein